MLRHGRGGLAAGGPDLKGFRPVASSNYPQSFHLKMPDGWRARIDRAAAADGYSANDWMRAIVRKALDASERQARRNRAT